MVLYQRDAHELVLKRIFDLVMSGLLILTFLSWLCLLVFIVNWLFSNMSTFYVQKRKGMNGVSFFCYKFKTMVDRPEEDILPDRDPCGRLNRFSRWLRQTGLDELPQLVNVWKGQMSLIGPRPYMEAETTELLKYRTDFRNRYLVKPGISGWAQIHGCKGPMRSMADIDRRLDLDLEYVRRWNFRMDLYIYTFSIWQAVLALFGHRVVLDRIQKESLKNEATGALSLDK